MKIIISELPQDPRISLIELVNELDFANAKEFSNQVIPLLEKGRLFFVIDLTKLEYINSTGIGCIADFFAKVKQKGGYLKFFGLTDRIKEVFELVGLTKILPMFNSLEEALKASP